MTEILPLRDTKPPNGFRQRRLALEPSVSRVIGDCLNKVYLVDTPSGAWREGPAVAEIIEPMAAQIDQQQLVQDL